MPRTLSRRLPLPRRGSPTVPNVRLILALAVALVPTGLEAQSLNGSPASLDLQNAQARAHNFTYLRTPQQVREYVNNGYLVPVVPNQDLDLHQVSFPYARPEVRVFIERLAAQYRSACGEKLVVTSLTRPMSNQPPNASSRSVHPTGMALDLRRPANARCREWLESTLLSLERTGVLDATYERNPPHYHVVVFPQPYANYLAQQTDNAAHLIQAARNTATEMRVLTHVVARGETLSALASRYNVPITRIRTENGLQGDRLLVGQQLRIPVYDAPAATQPTVAARTPTEAAPPVAANTSAAGPSIAAPAAAAASTAATQPPGAILVSGGGSNGGIVHTVGRGESLWTIARLYGISEDALRVANGISGNRILVGQALRVPVEVEASDTVPYRVQRGDSLWVIATRTGASVDDIRRLNGMASTRIYEGQVLEIPVNR